MAGAPEASAGGNGDGCEATAVETPGSRTGGVVSDGSVGLADTLLDVVAELTGYPVEMLDPDMDLEADLGIDSIKRVEILAAVERRIPGLESVDSSYIGSLRTLRNIIDYMQAPGTAAAAPVAPAPEVAPPLATSNPPVTEAADEAGSAATDLERRVLRVVALPAIDRPTESGRLEMPAERELWIIDDGTPLAAALCAKVQASGQAARVVPADVDTEGNGIARIGGLVLLSPPVKQDGALWGDPSEHRVKSAFDLIRRIGPVLRDTAAKGGAVVACVSRMDGAFGLIGGAYDPVQGALAGLIKTVACEWPAVRCRALDVDAGWDDADATADAILRELVGDGPIEVGLSDGVRRTLEAVPAPVTGGVVSLDDSDVVVITGGARGVTAEVALALARSCRATLVLLGRSPEPESEPGWLSSLKDETEIKRALIAHAFDPGAQPAPAQVESAYRRWMANREVARTVGRLKEAGAVVCYRSVDVRDGAAVQAALSDVRRRVGPIRAVIHAAGVIEDRRIDDKTMAQFERVFDTKVAGLRHVLEAVDADALKYLVLFSSVSARFGRAGQADYAMANEVLNKVAHRWAAVHPATRVAAINWGPWDGGMVTAALKRDFLRSGVGLIPVQSGARALVDELAGGRTTEIEILIGCSLPDTSWSRVADGATGAAAAPAGSAELSPMFERRLDLDRHRFLSSHVIGGHAVLPVAIMHEWLGHAALHDNPGLLLYGFDDFRVLKGVILNNGPCDLRAVASRVRRAGEWYEVDVELRSGPAAGSETLHARARAILAASLPPPPPYARPDRLDANPYGRGVQGAYNDVLFHGPHFHGLERIEGYSADGIVARVRSAPAPSDWMADPPRSAWLGDPLMVDAGLQLGILWCREVLEAVSLPAHGARFRQYVPVLPSEGATAVLHVRNDGGNGQAAPAVMTADIAFLDADGHLVMLMEGYSWTVDPALSEAFGRQTVAGARP